jgi:hypothetical protein
MQILVHRVAGFTVLPLFVRKNYPSGLMLTSQIVGTRVLCAYITHVNFEPI